MPLGTALDRLATILSEIDRERLQVAQQQQQQQEAQMSDDECMRWHELVAILSDIEKM